MSFENPKPKEDLTGIAAEMRAENARKIEDLYNEIRVILPGLVNKIRHRGEYNPKQIDDLVDAWNELKKNTGF